MKSKTVDLEINKANNGDNNSNVNFITIAHCTKNEAFH